MRATIYKSTGSWYSVKDEQGSFYNARIKGVFKIDDITSTNPLAVGDEVSIEMENEAERSVLISKIHDRHNYINRQSPKTRHQHHIIAANIDQSFLIATLKEPKTSQGFIDRFLVASEMYHVPSLIVFNKADLYKKKEEEKFEQWKDMYANAGYKVFVMSARENDGVNALLSELKDKITLISGPSGVVKPTLLNILLPGARLKTQDVSGWSGKGQHTTTFAEMFDLPAGGSIIETPDMREFGLVDIEKREVSHFFPE